MAAQGLQVTLRLVLARLLLPEDFGLVAMAVVFIGFCTQLLDLGLGPALVQRSDLSELHKSTAFWTATGIGAALTALFLVAAPLVGAFYSSPAVIPVVRALGLGFVLGAPQSIYRYLFEREFSFGVVGVRNLIGVALGGAIGITLALRGAGVWALVAENLVRTSTGSVLFAASSPWRPRLRFSRRALAELWSYSRSILGTRLVNFFNRNLDNLLIGRILGASALGFYSLAYQGVLLPLGQVARPIARVGFPAFASIQDNPERCASTFLSALRVSLLVSAPLPLLAIFLSPTAIPYLLGERWLPSVLPFQVLSAVALIQAGMSLSPPLFNALGRADLSFRWTLIALAANSVGIVAGLRWGISGVAVGYLTAVLATSPIQFMMVQRLIGLRSSQLWSVFRPMLLSIVAAAILPSVLLTTLSLSPFWTLVLVGSTLAAGYGIATRALAPEAWRLLRRSAGSVT